MAPDTLQRICQPVPIGQLVVCPVPALLTVHGLGSCVAIFLYSEKDRIGGLAHALLPSGSRWEREHSPGKYVPSAIESMLRKFVDLGVEASRLAAKLAGGASMFAGAGREHQGIGERNVRSALRALAERDIPVVGRDVGGCFGRIVQARTENGAMEVSTLREPPRLI